MRIESSESNSENDVIEGANNLLEKIITVFMALVIIAIFIKVVFL